MTSLSITIDTRGFEKATKRFKKQIPFIMSNALNKTALDIQKAQRANNFKKFTIRRKGFADRSVKITQFSKKITLEAPIQIISPGPTPQIFSQHEEGGIKRARSSRRVAIPQDILLNKQKVLTKSKRPTAILQKRGFIITTRSGQDLILQRKFRGRRSTTIIAFSLEDRVVIKPTLGFFKLSQGVYNSKFERHFVREFTRAIKTAR